MQVKISSDSLLKENPATWGKPLSNELGWLSQGIKCIVGKNAMMFIKRNDVPQGKQVAYVNMVYNYRPLKEENIVHD